MGTINIKKEVFLGFFISLIATSFGLFLYLQYISKVSFTQTLQNIYNGGGLGAAIVIAAIPNAFVFYVFLKKNQEYRSRGVLFGCIFIALLTFALKFV